MAVFDSTARKQLPAEPVYRTPPHNIEAEQALLGAILVNNEAFYRVSDFLEPKHFLETIHQRVFELAGSLIRAGKLATPVTLKTFLPAELDIAGLSLNQYLARLAAEATTIINAEDYGRTVYDLSTSPTMLQSMPRRRATSKTLKRSSTNSPKRGVTKAASSASRRR
jgi:replicative DNA helicase